MSKLNQHAKKPAAEWTKRTAPADIFYDDEAMMRFRLSNNDYKKSTKNMTGRPSKSNMGIVGVSNVDRARPKLADIFDNKTQNNKSLQSSLSSQHTQHLEQSAKPYTQ